MLLAALTTGPYPASVSDWLIGPLLSERVRLRPWAEHDERAIVALKTDPEVRRYLGGPQPAAKAVAGTRQQIAAQHWGHFAVTMRDCEDAIGTVSFDRKRGPWELSLQLGRDLWGRGLMTEAVKTAIAWFYETAPDVESLLAVTQSENTRTRALLLRCGAVQARTFTEHGAEQTEYRFSCPDPQPKVLPPA